MAEWKLALRRKDIRPTDSDPDPAMGSAQAAAGVIQPRAGTFRLRYETRLERAPGWRCSFMSY